MFSIKTQNTQSDGLCINMNSVFSLLSPFPCATSSLVSSLRNNKKKLLCLTKSRLEIKILFQARKEKEEKGKQFIQCRLMENKIKSSLDVV